MNTRRVRIWSIRVNTRRKKRTYTVRWEVAGRERGLNFVTRALADKYRSDLMQAINRGEPFDIETGLPESMVERPKGSTWVAFVQDYIAMKWPAAAAKTRVSIVEAMVVATIALVADIPGRPDPVQLRSSTRELLRPSSKRVPNPPSDMAKAWEWLGRASLPLDKLAEPATIRMALAALGTKVDGKPNAAATMRRRRAVLYNVLQYAVELDALPYNPVDKVKVPARKTKLAGTVDRRVVVNTQQAHELLVAVTYVGRRQLGQRLYALFACMYYAALRPAEALALREHDCALPNEGRGELTLERTRPNAGKRWTDSGDAHDDRGLKHRGDNEPRQVPIPPELVTILRSHVDKFGVGPDGGIIRTARGNVIASSTYSKVWQRARKYGLPPRQAASPLAARTYDLRHACVSLWLNAGVPAPEIAERAGHSVDVLLKVYAKCIDGQAASVNARIQLALVGSS